MFGNRFYFAFVIIAGLLVRSYFADTKVLYRFALDGDFSSHNETGELRNFGTPEEEYVVTGVISITYSVPNSDEVYTYTRTYTADKNGYTMKFKLKLQESEVGPRIGAGALMSSVGG